MKKVNNRGRHRIPAILLTVIMCLGFSMLCGCGDGESVVVHMAESETVISSQSGDSADGSDRAKTDADEKYAGVSSGGVGSDSSAASEGAGNAAAVADGQSNSSVKADSVDNDSEAKPGQDDASTGSAAGESESVSAVSPSTMYIYVCGAVRVPGVYELPSGSRIYQAIAAAGGLTEVADDRSLNQAQVLTDGQQVTVYTQEEAKTFGLDKQPVIQGDGTANADGTQGGSGVSSGTASGGNAGAGAQTGNDAGQQKVNLNTASAEELMTLPGIGEVRAAAIIQYRDENGGFSSVEDIKNIDGIKDKAFNKIKDYIEV